MKVSIIIVSFNNELIIWNCLSSIVKHVSEVDYEIIVVDNNSSDNTVNIVKEFDKVILVENKENKGFACANNQGYKIARGEYILLLNSDTELIENSVKQFLDFAETKSDIGIIGCQLINENGSFQNSAHNFPGIISIIIPKFILKIISPEKYRTINFREPCEVDAVLGACMFINRKALQTEANIFDENFFFFFEETDLCCRIRKNKYSVWMFPYTKIKHLLGSSVHKNYINGRIEYYKSLRYYFSKHYSNIGFKLFTAIINIKLILNFIFYGLLILTFRKKYRNKVLVSYYTLRFFAGKPGRYRGLL